MTTLQPDSQWWYDAHAARLLLYARQWLPVRADAEDAVQIGFVKFWRSRARPEASDLPLLFAAVRTASLNLIKSEQRQTNREQNALNGGPTVWWDADTLAEREWTEAVAQAIASLPLDQREALVLRICPTRWNASDRARIEPGSSIRLQIAADLATQSHDSLQDASRCTRAAVGEQLMWATGGAIAASLAFLLAGTAPVGREQPVAAAMHVISLVAPGEASPPRVREEAIG